MADYFAILILASGVLLYEDEAEAIFGAFTYSRRKRLLASSMSVCPHVSPRLSLDEFS
jgi:hypothetical protein